jgi:hypothetical protein
MSEEREPQEGNQGVSKPYEAHQRAIKGWLEQGQQRLRASLDEQQRRAREPIEIRQRELTEMLERDQERLRGVLGSIRTGTVRSEPAIGGAIITEEPPQETGAQQPGPQAGLAGEVVKGPEDNPPKL